MCVNPTTSLTWRSDEYTVSLVGLTSDTHTCAIMQEPTSDVELLGLPCTWTVRGATLNTVTLPCQHAFHPTALAQHFAYRDMRCPVCRAGHDRAIDFARSDVPSEVAAAIAEHVHAMHESDSDDDEPSEHLDAASVREMLSILAEFRYENRTLAVFTSRLIPDVETENDERQNFCPYRSFQRMLLNNAKRSTDTGITVRFQALHPILLEPIHSEHIPVASINGEFPMRCECTGSQVLASVLIAEPTVHVNVDVNAVQNICSNTIAAHIENFLRR